jgi:ribosomal protein S8E
VTEPQVFSLGLVVKGTSVRLTREPWERQQDGLADAMAHAKLLAADNVAWGAYAEVANPKPAKRYDDDFYQMEWSEFGY